MMERVGTVSRSDRKSRMLQGPKEDHSSFSSNKDENTKLKQPLPGGTLQLTPAVTNTTNHKFGWNTGIHRGQNRRKTQHAQAIDTMLNVNTLTQMQMKDLPQIFYTYLNSKVDSGLANIGADFLQWIKTSKVSAKKQQKIAEYLGQNKNAFDAMWKVVSGIMTIKDKVINQFDSHDADVTAEIGGHGPVSQDAHAAGGEGYVLAHPKGDIKLVPRASFTKANRSIHILSLQICL